MKKMIWLMLSLFMVSTLAACQPTPEQNVIVGKGDGKLGEIINASPAPVQKYQAPEQWETSFETKDGKSTILVNAAVSVPDTETYPVVQIKPAEITQEQANPVIQTLTQGNPLYKMKTDGDITKAEIEAMILERQAGVNSELKKSDPKAYEEAIQPEIEELTEQYKNAPETYTPTPADGQFSTVPGTDEYKEITVAADLGKPEQAKLYAETGGDNRTGYIRFYNYGGIFSAPVPGSIGIFSKQTEGLSGLSLTVKQAEELAQKTLSDAGLGYMSLSAVGSEKMTDSATGNAEANCYTFIFTRDVNGIPVTYTEAVSTSMEGEDLDRAIMTVAAEWSSERVIIRIDDTGVLGFEWNSPAEVTQTLSENAALLPFDEIQSRFQQQLEINDAWMENENIISRMVHIERITLGMGRIASKDNPDAYMLVPAWNFFGYSVDTYDTQQATQENQAEENSVARSYLALNAIDGSVIDQTLGY